MGIHGRFKVFFVTETFFPATIGGTEIYVLNLCKELIRNDVICKVFCTGNVQEIEQFEYDHVPVVICPRDNEEGLFNALSSAKITEGFDILHIHSFNGPISNNFLLQARGLGISIFFTPHLVNNFCGNNNGSLRYRNRTVCNGVVKAVKCQTCTFSNHQKLPFYYRSTLFNYIVHYVISRKAARRFLSKQHFAVYAILQRIYLLNQQNVQVVALSDWYGQLLKENGLKSVTVIQQGVSADFPFSHNEKEAQSGNSIHWIFIGRMSEEKGVRELINAFSAVADPRDQLSVVTIEPKLKNKYFDEVVSLIKRNPKISVVYNRSSSQVAHLLAAADCLVLPSKITEMAPLVVQESIAVGRPVLVSDFIREDVESKQLGLKFFINKTGDFEAKMREMKVKVSSRQFSDKKNFTALPFSKIALKHIALYERFIGVEPGTSYSHR